MLASRYLSFINSFYSPLWWLSHTDYQSPRTWYDARLEVGEIKTRPYNSGGWTGMYSNGEYRGNYGGPGPMPFSLRAEIEIQS